MSRPALSIVRETPPATSLRPRFAGPEFATALAILLSFLVVWPVGDYVIEDDWSYTRSLVYLHDAGVFKILDWNPMTLVSHLLWGLLFVKTLGVSFTVAKLSTVVLLLVECLALIGLLRHLRIRETTITLAVLTMVFNPLHFFQSFLYATDVPALAWSMLALLFFAKGLTTVPRRSYRFLLWASVFATLAGGVRQSGLLISAAVFAYLLFFDRTRLKDPRLWLCCWFFPALGLLLFTWWYYSVHGPTAALLAASEDTVRYLRHMPLQGAAQIIYILLSYIGFFLFPLLAATPLRHYRPARGVTGKVGILISIGLLVIFLWMTLAKGISFPYLRNKITMFGFLSPNEIILGARDVLWTPKIGWAASFAFFLGAVGFVLRWVADRSEPPRVPDGISEIPEEYAIRKATLRLVGVVFSLQLAYSFAVMGITFDRHLLIFLPTSLVLFTGSLGPNARPRPTIVALCLLPLAFYSLAGTHDVHAFSRTAFKAGQDLIAKGIEPRMIDAGYAFDGWHMYERSRQEIMEENKPILARPGDAWYVAAIAPRIITKFVVSLSQRMERDTWSGHVSSWARSFALAPQLENYSRFGEYTYRNYWPPENKQVYVLVDKTLPNHLHLERLISEASE